MKDRFRSLLFFSIVSCLLIVMGSCASSQRSGSGGVADEWGGTDEIHITNPSVTLADYLRRVNGVWINGQGASTTITIRGSNSLSAEAASHPLFVLDGIKVGRDFARVNSLVSMTEVTKIKVLKGVEASAGYGMEGGYGVIEIFTKPDM